MIASRIREIRGTLGLSMPAFGQKLGCSRDVVANIEYGRSEPKEVFLNHLCDIYGVNRQWLYYGEGPMFGETAGDAKVREAAELFRSLSADLREIALSQMKSLKKLMIKEDAVRAQCNGSHLDTIRLMAAMLDAQEFGQWNSHADGESPVGWRIRSLMEEKNLSSDALAARCVLSQKELDRIMDAGGSATRDTLISICLALSLDVEETQRLLTSAGLPALYAKNRRDAACIFALMKGLDMEALNEMLAGLEEAAL